MEGLWIVLGTITVLTSIFVLVMAIKISDKDKDLHERILQSSKDYLSFEEAIKEPERKKEDNICPRCGGKMTKVSGGYHCDYCEYEKTLKSTGHRT